MQMVVIDEAFLLSHSLWRCQTGDSSAIHTSKICKNYYIFAVFLKQPRNISLIDHDKEMGNNCLNFTAFPKHAANTIFDTTEQVADSQEKLSQDPPSSTTSTSARVYFGILERQGYQAPSATFL